jgi:ribosomal protein S1
MFRPENYNNKHELNINIDRAIRSGSVIEAFVQRYGSDNKLEIYINNNVKGIIERDEIEFRPDGKEVTDSAIVAKVGKYIKCKALRIENGIVICSRKELQKECYTNYISKLRPGDVIDARVTAIDNRGLFCDIGCGLVGFIHYKNIAIARIVDLEYELSDVKNIKAVIKKNDDGLIELTHKELLGTFEEESENIETGDILVGTVTSCKEYGIFIRVSQNLSVLADVSSTLEVAEGNTVRIRIVRGKEGSIKLKAKILEKLDDRPRKLSFNYRVVPDRIEEWKYSKFSDKIITRF